MFDIDKALTNIKQIPQQPSERLRESTRQLVAQEVRKKQGIKRSGRLTWALPAVAAMLAAFVFLFTLPPAADEVSFITVDINPSISMQVNTSGEVLAVSAENDDATVLLQSLSLTGLQFEEALKVVVRTADEQGYLKEDGHVLVACFGGADGISQQAVQTAVAESTGREVKVLLIQSDKDTFENAKALHQRPGVELLKKKASEQGINEQDVDRIIEKMQEKYLDEGQSDIKPTPTVQPDGRPSDAQNNEDKGSSENNGKGEHSRDTEDKTADLANDKAEKTPAPQDKPKGSGNGENGQNGNGNGEPENDENKGNNEGKKQNTESIDRSKNNK